MQGCVRRLEGGLRHQSVGTLVTSAEPRVERPWIPLGLSASLSSPQDNDTTDTDGSHHV